MREGEEEQKVRGGERANEKKQRHLRRKGGTRRSGRERKRVRDMKGVQRGKAMRERETRLADAEKTAEEGKRERRVRLLRVSCACSTLPSRPLHLSTGSPEDKLPRNKNTEKIICLPAARASGERRAKEPLGFPTNAGKRRAEDSDAEVTGRRRKRRRGEQERSRWTRGEKETRREKSARRFAREDEGRDKERLQGGKERRRRSERAFSWA